MPLPEFTHDEQYLISYVKSPRAAHGSNSHMWGYMIGASMIAASGFYHNSVPTLLIAFVLVCGFRLYENRYHSKWIPLWRSIIDKYEAAATGAGK